MHQNNFNRCTNSCGNTQSCRSSRGAASDSRMNRHEVLAVQQRQMPNKPNKCIGK